MRTKPTLNIALIGHGFMGKAHSNAWRQVPRFFDLAAELRLQTICGRNKAALSKSAAQFGWEQTERDWRRAVADPAVDIVDICTPNNSHCEIAMAAAIAGKAILCEKPLARCVAEAKRMVRAVSKAKVANMVCYNYRRVPAIALAKQMVSRGELGQRIFHFRARYAQDWIVDPQFPLVWRLQSGAAGSGALGDILSHIVDLGRYLIGEFREVCATADTFIRQRPLLGPRKRAARASGKVTVDDAVAMVGRFENGAMANLEATRFAPGRKNGLTFEINGSDGSLAFNLEEMNRLRFFNRRDRRDRQGFRDILVTERSHPYIESWWPPGHLIGYEHSFIHTVAEFINGLTKPAHDLQPNFEDALKTQRILEAIGRSAETRRWIQLSES